MRTPSIRCLGSYIDYIDYIDYTNDYIDYINYTDYIDYIDYTDYIDLFLFCFVSCSTTRSAQATQKSIKKPLQAILTYLQGIEATATATRGAPQAR